jgi:PAS domain S-box-containing protein
MNTEWVMQYTTDFGVAFGADLARQLISIFHATADGIWVCNAEPRLLWVNDACEQLNNIRREEVCGRLVRDLLESGNFDHDVSSLVLQSGRTVTISQKVRSGRTLLVSGMPVFDENGALVYVVGSERDLTELNLLKEEVGKNAALSERLNSELLALKLRDLKHTRIVARSDAMDRALDTAIRVASFDATVLLSGPTGVGKSMMARVIHEASARRDRPFLSLNCGAFPTALLDAELFGYADGAFTGARRGGKLGLLEAANSGTLLLDEIDAFPVDVQVKLLTFLDTQTFMRVGDTKPRQVDVRLIAATNRNLSDLVAAGQFRKDLLFRLNVVPLEIPPLSARRIDIPELVRAQLDHLQRKYKVRRRMAQDALDALCRHDFPGNVRELQNVVERAFVLATSEEIALADLVEEVRRSEPADFRRSGESFRDARSRAERGWLLALRRKHARQKDIAAELGVSQPTVARLLRKHGIL